MPRRSRTTRSAEELEELSSTLTGNQTSTPGPAELASAEALVQALRLLGLPNKELFRPPTFMGEGDVELFVKQFDDVAEANGWTEVQQTLHLRTQLQGAAQNCGRGSSKAEIVGDLRARFGLTCRQAKDRLRTLRRGQGQSLHALCTEIARLVELGFPILPRPDQDAMVLDYFMQAVENKALQRHMLTVKPGTPMEAVQAAEEFFTAGGSERTFSSQRAMPVEADYEVVAMAREDQLHKSLAGFSQLLEGQTALLTKLLDRLEDRRPVSTPAQTGTGRVRCYECGGPHFKRHCTQESARQGSNGRANGSGTNQPAQRSRPGNDQDPLRA